MAHVITLARMKQAAQTLRADLAGTGTGITHALALELTAHQWGFADWNTAHAALAGQDRAAPTGSAAPGTEPGGGSPAGLGAPVPVLRVQDGAVAEEFYLGYLGFTRDWVHRFEPDLPTYTAIHRDRAVLHLSEHHGDGTPGSVVWLPVADVTALHRELTRRGHPRLRPGVDAQAPGGPTMSITDPFGNTLRLCQPRSATR